MMVFRLAHQQYIDDREGTGARLFGGRWNKVNEACIYASEHVSLAFLEKFVHARAKEDMMEIALLEIELPNEDEWILHVDADKLDENWRNDVTYTQWIGEQILSDLSILAFSVPSVLVPQERNYILNPKSVYFKQVKYKHVTNFSADYRLLSVFS